MKPELSPLQNAVLMQLGNAEGEVRDTFENHIFREISRLSQEIKDGNSRVVSLRADADEAEQQTAAMVGRYEALAESLQVYYQARAQGKAPEGALSPQNAPVSPEGTSGPDVPEQPETPKGGPTGSDTGQSEPSPEPSSQPEPAEPPSESEPTDSGA